MNKIKYIIIILLNFGYLGWMSAQDCSPATADHDLAVNNVRARLQGGGDVWWDGSTGRYVVPKVEAGFDEVSSIFAAAVWIGGLDPGGNLKVAAQSFGRSTGNFDFYPGPLNPVTGTTTKDTCELWDRHFVVYGKEIDKHRANYEKSVLDNSEYDPASIPAGVKGWPAKGNPFFLEIQDFELPNTSQGLASFHDAEPANGIYDPTEGDYPVIEIRGCETPQYPDEMVFWIYNDAGGTHKQSNADAIQMEVQVQAFAYATNDELNDMTFMRYKLINRAIEDIDSCYFGFWIDPDLGCSEDDYIGCDTTIQIEVINGQSIPRSRDLMYVYNEDVLDGNPGCNCAGGAPTYCDEVPILGVDYFRGPLKPDVIDGVDTLIELGMSSFVYYNRGVSNPPPGTTDPGTAPEFYNYLTGKWKDGTPFTQGGSGYGGTIPTNFAFPGAPNDDNGWSMCTANLAFDDRRTVQASGPFLLVPGAVNELIVGVPWIPNIDYPCPDISRLLFADDLAQSLFNNCFDITDGPDAPDVDFVELDREVIAVFSNDPSSNNLDEKYIEVDLKAPPEPDPFYRFQGYKLYQLAGPTVTTGELDNPSKAALVYQCDIVDGVSKIYNWKTSKNPSTSGADFIYTPELRVEGGDKGIQHTVKLTDDRFATDDRKLVNNKKYYYVAVAYAYNNYIDFNANTAVGQKSSYLEGRRNIKTYVVTPRKIVDKNLNSDYGTSVEITRVDGVGAGHLEIEQGVLENVGFQLGETRLVLTKASEDAIINGDFDNKTAHVTYEKGTGPFDVKIYDPLRVKGGDFILKFIDDTDDDVTSETYWELSRADDPNFSVICDTTISKLNEQLIVEHGFSITVGQSKEAGELQKGNGFTGQVVMGDLTDNDIGWLRIAPAGSFQGTNYLPITNGQKFNRYDPDASFANAFFVPFDLCEYKLPDFGGLITPGWVHPNAGQLKRNLKNLNNVDIVWTSDKAKWSRCVVLETSTPRMYGDGDNDQGWPTIGGAENMRMRESPSVGKDGKPDGDGNGMGWFPGYAIDVETGKRLDIFFGENSSYNPDNIGDSLGMTMSEGTDMLYNPGRRVFNFFVPPNSPGAFINMYLGGQHMVWVSDYEYDECAYFRKEFSKSDFKMIKPMNRITWAALTFTNEGVPLNSIEEGLIPADLKITTRVDNPYAKYNPGSGVETGPNNGLPMYTFKFDSVEPSEFSVDEQNSALDQIAVVPNPYYAYSAYETSQHTNVVKITNLPAKCTVDIFSLDGKFIRQYKRDEAEILVSGVNRAIPSAQINAGVEWDMKNSKGIPVASGVYLIHIDAGEKGERVIKWFGVARQFDPSGL